MTVRARIHKSAEPEDVLKRISKQFRGLLSKEILGSEPIDVIVFEPGNDEVVTSKNLKMALKKRGVSVRSFVIIGHEFTEEASALAIAEGGRVFAHRSAFGWTDDRWDEVRNRFGR